MAPMGKKKKIRHLYINIYVDMYKCHTIEKKEIMLFSFGHLFLLANALVNSNSCTFSLHSKLSECFIVFNDYTLMQELVAKLWLVTGFIAHSYSGIAHSYTRKPTREQYFVLGGMKTNHRMIEELFLCLTYHICSFFLRYICVHVGT